jgi:hypothetical protein
LCSLLSLQDRDAFRVLVQWNATYASIQGFFADRGHKVSINAVHHWWKATQPNLEETRILNALAEQVDVKDFHRLHGTALKLAVMATRILDEYINGKLANLDPQALADRQRELFTGALELAKLSRGGAI